jgi:hypothetical protein
MYQQKLSAIGNGDVCASVVLAACVCCTDVVVIALRIGCAAVVNRIVGTRINRFVAAVNRACVEVGVALQQFVLTLGCRTVATVNRAEQAVIAIAGIVAAVGQSCECAIASGCVT